MTTIHFYRTRDAYGAFSNFASSPILLRGHTWPTSEHFFQAQKLVGSEHEDRIRMAPSPAEAARLGRLRSVPIRADWERVKVRLARGDRADRSLASRTALYWLGITLASVVSAVSAY